MSQLHDQALGFVEVLQSGKPEAFFMACLGHKGLPSPDDFRATGRDSIQRSDEFLICLGIFLKNLNELHRERPRQKEFFEEKPEARDPLAGAPVGAVYTPHVDKPIAPALR